MAQSPGRITAGIGSLGSPIGSDIGGTNRNRFISGGQKVRILTIDGGGIFGILAVENLIALEEIIREETGDDNAALSDYIDFVVGSSIGGIIATSILMPSDPEDPMSPPRYSVRQVAEKFQTVINYVTSSFANLKISSKFAFNVSSTKI